MVGAPSRTATAIGWGGGRCCIPGRATAFGVPAVKGCVYFIFDAYFFFDLFFYANVFFMRQTRKRVRGKDSGVINGYMNKHRVSLKRMTI